MSSMATEPRHGSCADTESSDALGRRRHGSVSVVLLKKPEFNATPIASIGE
jgi:hypothetical protein